MESKWKSKSILRKYLKFTSKVSKKINITEKWASINKHLDLQSFLCHFYSPMQSNKQNEIEWGLWNFSIGTTIFRYLAEWNIHIQHVKEGAHKGCWTIIASHQKDLKKKHITLPQCTGLSRRSLDSSDISFVLTVVGKTVRILNVIDVVQSP